MRDSKGKYIGQKRVFGLSSFEDKSKIRNFGLWHDDKRKQENMVVHRVPGIGLSLPMPS